jgi:hypothetical protein
VIHKGGCDWKVTFATLAEAEDAYHLTPSVEKRTGFLLPYRCDEHGGFHLGHTRTGRKTKPEPHTHRWLIETPTPGVRALPGSCACGETKEFPAYESALEGNWLDKYARTRKRTQPRVAKGARG